MNSRPLNCGAEFRKNVWRQWQRPLEDEREAGLRWRHESERDLRRVTFLAAEAGPEGGVDDRFNRLCIWFRRQVLLTPLPRCREMSSEVRLDARGYCAGCLIGRLLLMRLIYSCVLAYHVFYATMCSLRTLFSEQTKAAQR
jgi:hypothetical protein